MELSSYCLIAHQIRWCFSSLCLVFEVPTIRAADQLAPWGSRTLVSLTWKRAQAKGPQVSRWEALRLTLSEVEGSGNHLTGWTENLRRSLFLLNPHDKTLTLRIYKYLWKIRLKGQEGKETTLREKTIVYTNWALIYTPL